MSSMSREPSGALRSAMAHVFFSFFTLFHLSLTFFCGRSFPLRRPCLCNSVFHLTNVVLIELALTEATKKKPWHALSISFKVFFWWGIIRSIISTRNNQWVPLQNSDQRKSNYRSKNGGFLSFKLVINKIKYLGFSTHYNKKERLLNMRSWQKREVWAFCGQSFKFWHFAAVIWVR